MNYQNLLCLGDSQTSGARSYDCYPLHLARLLSQETPYAWRAIPFCANGYTARDLWFVVNREIDTVADTYQACLLIGANDVGENKDVELFAEYYRQILRALFVKRYKAVFCGEVPPIFPDGHIFFDRDCPARRAIFNQAIGAVVAEFPQATLVTLGHLSREQYEDPVHFNRQGNVAVAQAFKEAILRR
jgi:lysophospholipase L1-like esterase